MVTVANGSVVPLFDVKIIRSGYIVIDRVHSAVSRWVSLHYIKMYLPVRCVWVITV